MTTREESNLSPAEKRKLKKRKVILEAATKIFAQNGYSDSKMSDIADEAGVSKGTMYNYFNSKEALFSELFYKEVSHSASLDEIAEMDIPGKEKMLLFVNDWFDRYDERKYFGILVLEFLLAALHQGGGEFMDFFKEFEANRIKALAKICDQWNKEQAHDIGLNPHDDATIVNSLFAGLMVRRLLGFETESTEYYRKIIEKLFFHTHEKTN